MMKGLSEEQKKEIIPPHTILLGYRGSVAHGTYTPSYGTDCHDDKDLLGVCLAKLNCYIGLSQFEQREKVLKDSAGVEWDSVIYELTKFVRLLLKSNPNVLNLLWLPDNLYVIKEATGQLLIDNREIFISKKVYHSFTGYAYGQLKKMESLPTGRMGAKRKELKAKFGYDTKNAGHLIRLLRMGIEFLTDGKLHIVREDATELIDIKQGKWTLDRIKNHATELFSLAKEAFVRSDLPPEPDKEKAEKIVTEIIGDYIVEQRSEHTK
jgi:predicted nucleotidyltransferase